MAVIKRVADELRDDVRLERAPALEGRALSMILIPAPQRADRPEKAEQKTEEMVEDLADAKT